MRTTEATPDMPTVTLLADDGSAVVFRCPAGVVIDEAARAAGYRLRVVCARGGCGACRATLVSGRVDLCGPVSVTKTEDPATGRHYELLCRATPVTDVVVHPVAGWKEHELHPWSRVRRTDDQGGH